MGLTPNFTMEGINKALEKKAELIRKAIIRRLTLLGEMCVAEARTNKGYGIITGNLTSSIGYVVIDHGTIVNVAGFEKSTTGSSANTGANGTDGMKNGKGLAETLAKGWSRNKGYTLIIVAGMHYASYVESTGRNVLASAELLAERELPEMLKKLKNNISKMK